jgi:polysaccharide export outer membrane protein
MVRRLLPWSLLVIASCGGMRGRAPTRADFDPAVAGSRPAHEVQLPENQEVGEILDRYERALVNGYPIHSGDDLRFAVQGQSDLTFEARVPQDGAIQFPLIGKVALAGRIPEQVRLDIKGRLEKDYLVSADVTVQVKEYSRTRVYVLGAVAKPLEGDIPGGRSVTLLQAIAQAGGFREDAAKHGVVIYRLREAGATARVAIPFSMAALHEGRGRDPILMPDDIVLVPSREKVFVLGEVARPGAFDSDADHGLTAAQAISLAGGFTRIANDSTVRLLRRDKSGARRAYVLNLARVAEGRPEEDVPLQPGDLLFVPESLF